MLRDAEQRVFAALFDKGEEGMIDSVPEENQILMTRYVLFDRLSTGAGNPT